MKNTIKTIALSVAFLSGAGMAYAQDDETPTEVTVDTGLQATLESISQQVENGSALNLAVNTGDVDASVDLQALERYQEKHRMQLVQLRVRLKLQQLVPRIQVVLH